MMNIGRTQRANVESARNAGVHPHFSAAMRCFGRALESSIDGSGTPYRTLVYKETHANAKIDPTST
jgi:hypothetical protein